MQAKSWLSIPYNYTYVVTYVALGIALCINPATRITGELASMLPFLSISAANVGRIIGTIFLLMSYMLWTHEPKGVWILRSLIPVGLFGCYTIASILGNETASYTSAVMIAGFLGLLVYNGEQRQTLINNEVVNEQMIKEKFADKETIKALQAELDKLKPQVAHD
jgi:hypothetical protein